MIDVDVSKNIMQMGNNRTLRNDVWRIVDPTNVQDEVSCLLFRNKATVCLIQHHLFKGYNAFQQRAPPYSEDTA